MIRSMPRLLTSSTWLAFYHQRRAVAVGETISNQILRVAAQTIPEGRYDLGYPIYETEDTILAIENRTNEPVRDASACHTTAL